LISFEWVLCFLDHVTQPFRSFIEKPFSQVTCLFKVHPQPSYWFAWGFFTACCWLIFSVDYWTTFYVDSISSLPSIDHNCLDRSVHTCLFVFLNSQNKICIHLAHESESAFALRIFMFEKLKSKI
jgi:hypothetical protein